MQHDNSEDANTRTTASFPGCPENALNLSSMTALHVLYCPKKNSLVSTRKNCISMQLSRAWCLFLVVLRFALWVCCKFAQQEGQLLWNEFHMCIEVYLRKVSKSHILRCGQPQPTHVHQKILNKYHSVDMFYIPQVGCCEFFVVCLPRTIQWWLTATMYGFLLPVLSSKRRCIAPFMSCHCQI